MIAEPARLVSALRTTDERVYLLVARILAAAPLLGIGLAHILVPGGSMRPLVDALGVPFAALVSPLAVAFEIIAAVSLLLGAWARVGAILAIPTMAVAFYAHFAIDPWPGDGPPPDALPLVVIAGSALVLWQGAGRWSLDLRSSR